MLESTIVRKIREMLSARGCWSVKFHGSVFAPKGNSDIYACCKGRFVALEVKVPGEGPTKLQQKTLDELKNSGAVTAVVHSVEEAESVLSKADL